MMRLFHRRRDDRADTGGWGDLLAALVADRDAEPTDAQKLEQARRQMALMHAARARRIALDAAVARAQAGRLPLDPDPGVPWHLLAGLPPPDRPAA